MINFGSATKTVVYTNINTPFDEWKIMCNTLFIERHFDASNINPLKYLHGYESGDTPYGWTDFIIRQYKMQERTKQIKRDNPQNYD
jgi:hypothetical protein